MPVQFDDPDAFHQKAVCVTQLGPNGELVIHKYKGRLEVEVCHEKHVVIYARKSGGKKIIQRFDLFNVLSVHQIGENSQSYENASKEEKIINLE